MSKMVGYFFFLMIILLFFNLTGLIPAGSTPVSNLVALAMSPESITNTSLYTIISLAIGAAIVAGAAFGSAVMYRTNMVFKASVTALLLTFIPDIVVLYNTLSSQVASYFAIIVCGPLAVLSLVILVEWWAGEG